MGKTVASKEININFVGFWPGFEKTNNFITNALKKKYIVNISEKPQYLFSSCFSDEYLDYECVRIFYTGENLSPNFNVFDYAIGYEEILFDDRYFRLPNYYIEENYGNDVHNMLNKHMMNIADVLDKKKDFCSFVVSKGNGYVDSSRESFFRLLSQYKKVNSGGRFLNNIGKPNGVEDKFEFQLQHKFAIAFENVSHKGYTTEKIVQAFAACTVPIYWGDPYIGNTFNEDAFINCHRFSDFDKVIDYIKYIDQNEDVYTKMIQAPAVNDVAEFLMQKERFEEFLYYIVEQEYDKAFRRDRVGYGKMENDKLIKFSRYGLKKKVFRFVSKYL